MNYVLRGLLGLTLVFFGCQIPVNQKSADFQLSLVFSKPSLRALGAESRLLLPTAARVSLSVTTGGSEVDSQSAATDGLSPVRFVLKLPPLLNYTLTATARDASGVLVFAGTTTIQLTGDLAGTLNLFPVDASGALSWPSVTATPANQPAGGDVAQSLNLATGSTQSFLLDWGAGSAFTFQTAAGLELYAQSSATGSPLSIPGSKTLTRAAAGSNVWITYYARSSPASLATLGRFAIPVQTLSLTAPVAVVTNGAASLKFTPGSIVPINSTEATLADFDWTSSRPDILSITSVGSTSVTFTTSAVEGLVDVTAAAKTNPAVSAKVTINVNSNGFGNAQSGIAAEPTIEFTTPLTGQTSWAFDQTLAVTATSADVGTWAWLFDGQLVPGQTNPGFSALASSLTTVPGAHILTALFTTNGATWARQKAVFLNDLVGDVTLSIRAQKTVIAAAGATSLVVGDAGLTVVLSDNDVDELWYAIDSWTNPVDLVKPTDSVSGFTASTTGLAWGIHTLNVQARFRDGRIGGVLVPFELRPLGAADGLFQLALPARFLPPVTGPSFKSTFFADWALDDVSTINLDLTMPALPVGYAADATLLRVTFNGQVTVYDDTSATPLPTSEPYQLAIALDGSALPPGIYPVTIELWGGATKADRRSLGSQTFVISAFAGGTPQ